MIPGVGLIEGLLEEFTDWERGLHVRGGEWVGVFELLGVTTVTLEEVSGADADREGGVGDGVKREGLKKELPGAQVGEEELLGAQVGEGLVFDFRAEDNISSRCASFGCVPCASIKESKYLMNCMREK